MQKIAIIGECMIEISGQPFSNIQQSYGGDTLNTATYLARITPKERLKIYYISALGNDNLSNTMIKYWELDNINTNFVIQDEYHQPGLYLIQVDEKGERTFLYWRKDSAARYMLKHDKFKHIMKELENFDLVYLSGISLAILNNEDRISLIEYLSLLSNRGVKIIFDTNYRPILWNTIEETKEIYKKMFSITDIALVTLEDEQLLWQDQNTKACIQRLSNIGVKLIIVKEGEKGVSYQDNKQIYHISTEVIKPIDTTSAGDAFNAGFLNGYINGQTIESCCKQGNKIARVVIQHKGAIIKREYTQHLFSEFNQ